MSVQQDLVKLVSDTAVNLMDGQTAAQMRKRKQYIDLFDMFITTIKDTVTPIEGTSVWDLVEAYKNVLPKCEEMSEIILHVEGHIQTDISDRGGLKLNVAFQDIASLGGFYERLSASTTKGSAWLTMKLLMNTTGGFTTADLKGFTVPQFEAILTTEKAYLDAVSKKFPELAIEEPTE